MKTCFYCDEPGDLRPYGPGGTSICFSCIKASPEREAAAAANYGALLVANEVISPSGAVVLTSDGPEPFVTSGDRDGRP